MEPTAAASTATLAGSFSFLSSFLAAAGEDDASTPEGPRTPRALSPAAVKAATATAPAPRRRSQRRRREGRVSLSMVTPVCEGKRWSLPPTTNGCEPRFHGVDTDFHVGFPRPFV